MTLKLLLLGGFFLWFTGCLAVALAIAAAALPRRRGEDPEADAFDDAAGDDLADWFADVDAIVREDGDWDIRELTP